MLGGTSVCSWRRRTPARSHVLRISALLRRLRTVLPFHSWPPFSNCLSTRSLPFGGPISPSAFCNPLNTPAPSRGGAELGGLAWSRPGQGICCFVPAAGSSECPPWKYPLVLRAVKMVSLFRIVITGERNNFSETISSTPETSLLTFSSFVAHLLSGPICLQHLARLPVHFHNNNTLYFSRALSCLQPRALFKQ